MYTILKVESIDDSTTETPVDTADTKDEADKKVMNFILNTPPLAHNQHVDYEVVLTKDWNTAYQTL